MPPLVIPNTVRVGLVWQLGGQDAAVNVMHFLVPPSVDADDSAFATGTAIIVTSAMSTLTAGGTSSPIDTEWSLDRVTTRWIGAPAAPEYTGTVSVPGTGTLGQIMPAANAICVTLRTAFAGRSYRGRVYVPGWNTTAMTTTGQIATGARNRASAFVSDIQAGMFTSLGVSLGVASPTLGETNSVTSILTRDDQWDVQRRRNVPGI